MTRKNRKAKHRRHFICKWCDQDKEAPVVGKDRLGRRSIICPGCRGPVYP